MPIAGWIYTAPAANGSHLSKTKALTRQPSPGDKKSPESPPKDLLFDSMLPFGVDCAGFVGGGLSPLLLTTGDKYAHTGHFAVVRFRFRRGWESWRYPGREISVLCIFNGVCKCRGSEMAQRLVYLRVQQCHENIFNSLALCLVSSVIHHL